jgi:hypothetical protein
MKCSRASECASYAPAPPSGAGPGANRVGGSGRRISRRPLAVHLQPVDFAPRGAAGRPTQRPCAGKRTDIAPRGAAGVNGPRSHPARGKEPTLPRAVPLAGPRSHSARGKEPTLPRAVPLAGPRSDPARGKERTLPRPVPLAGPRNDPPGDKVSRGPTTYPRTASGGNRWQGHHDYHHCCSSLASIERTKSRVQPAQTQRVRFPSLVSTMSAHHVSGGSPSSSGSATRPQMEHVSCTSLFYPRRPQNRIGRPRVVAACSPWGCRRVGRSVRSEPREPAQRDLPERRGGAELAQHPDRAERHPVDE